MKKLLVIFLIAIIGCFLIDNYYIKNMWCKTESYRYEIWGSTPVDITEKIENGECECITESLIIEKNPDPLSKDQIFAIKKELPNWAIKNIRGFTNKDKDALILELSNLNDKEFRKSIHYKYTFLENITGSFVPVYTFKIKSYIAYLPNYTKAYDLYDGKYSLKRDSGEPFGKKPVYQIIESVT